MSADEMGPISGHDTLDRRCERCLAHGREDHWGKYLLVEEGAPIYACYRCVVEAEEPPTPWVTPQEFAHPSLPPVPVASIPEPPHDLPPVVRGPGDFAELVATAVLVTGVGFTVGHLFAWAQRVFG